MRVTINDNNKISQTKQGAKKSKTLIAYGLPTGLVEKHYDIKLSNIQNISLNYPEITSDSKDFF